ncbi:MAG: ubiquinone/menaquinone biosynthesis methyltransferase [Anaerolineales bacterium]|nr:ubiquinone/menaquinone biosynthesis methyltransferase [Anaerolineae bacterium]MBL6979658.1 ubiquinone/menaquinone biosynthesis methyltransferase [Anaerolineales bacterium]
MAHLTGSDRADFVQGMFTRIAHRYDLMNRLMTAGQDARWRREAIRRAALPPGRSIVLDLGAGTGDLAFDALRRHPETTPIAADFTLAMMRVGQKRQNGHQLNWSSADALKLPYPNETFDAVVSGFLLRNVIDIQQALAEQFRVIKPGGMMVALDTTRPRENLLSPLIHFHMKTVIPTLGRMLTGQADAYTYLPDSSINFLRAEEMAARMAAVGFSEINFERKMFGVVAIHWGRK